jgi:hypothetical protein
MKAHRREAKNCALIECAQVAAEKANWSLRDEFRRMSSRTGGGAQRVGDSADRTRAPAPALVPAPSVRPAPATATPQRVAYERPAAAAPAHNVPPPPPQPPSPPPAAQPAGSTHGAARFSSVFGTRRR